MPSKARCTILESRSRLVITATAVLVAGLSSASWAEHTILLVPDAYPLPSKVASTVGSNAVANGRQVVSVEPLLLPFVDSIVSTLDDQSATSNANLDNDAFAYQFELQRSPNADHLAFSENRLIFESDKGLYYEITGELDATDADGRNVRLVVSLSSNGSTLFDSRQGSEQTPDQRFVVGGADGDLFNIHAGKSTGWLEGGQVEHGFYAGASIAAGETDGTQAATALGEVTLRLYETPPGPLRGVTPADGEVVRKAPVFRWAPGPHSIFLFWADLGLPGGVRFSYPVVRLEPSFALPRFVYDALDPSATHTWRVIGFDTNTRQLEVTPPYTFDKRLRLSGTWNLTLLTDCLLQGSGHIMVLGEDNRASIEGLGEGDWTRVANFLTVKLDEGGSHGGAELVMWTYSDDKGMDGIMSLNGSPYACAHAYTGD